MEHLSYNPRLDKKFVIDNSTSRVGRAAFDALKLPSRGISVREAVGRAGAYAASRAGTGYREFADALTRYLGIEDSSASAGLEGAAPAGTVRVDEGSLYAVDDFPVDVGSVKADDSTLGDVGGAPYRRRERQSTPHDEGMVFPHNPDLIDRGTIAHMDIQDLLSDFVHSHGLVPLRPLSSDPQFDLAWRDSSSVVVCEVKSLTAENEVSQLRLGLGQVLSYIYKLNWPDAQEIRGVLAVEREPVDGDWIDICGDNGVTLTWAPDFPFLL